MDDRATWSLQRAVFRLVVFVMLGTALAYGAAPFLAFRAVKAAARDGDGQALAQLVDYGAVRQGLRSQVGAEPVAAPAPPDIWTDPVGAVKRAIEPVVPLPPAVEPYLSAGGLYDLARGYRPGRAPADERQGGHPKLKYWDLNRVRIAVPPSGAKSLEGAALFTFERRGPFDWTLVQIRLPETAH